MERAGVIVLRDGHLALIERQHDGRHYWVLPGGGIEPGESVPDAALREAREELGVEVELGSLRVRIDHRERDGSVQRQWYFDAKVADPCIQVVGPELEDERGLHTAVWVGIGELRPDEILPSAVVRWLVAIRGEWPDEVVTIDERADP